MGFSIRALGAWSLLSVNIIFLVLFLDNNISEFPLLFFVAMWIVNSGLLLGDIVYIYKNKPEANDWRSYIFHLRGFFTFAGIVVLKFVFELLYFFHFTARYRFRLSLLMIPIWLGLVLVIYELYSHCYHVHMAFGAQLTARGVSAAERRQTARDEIAPEDRMDLSSTLADTTTTD